MSPEVRRDRSDDHWLARPKTIRLLWAVFILALMVMVVPGFVIHQHQVFGLEASFAFYAWYGFATCVGMAVFAKLLGIFLKREDTYYDAR